MLKRRMGRFYTSRSYKLMERTRLVVVTITSPIWFPLYLISLIDSKIEDLLMFCENILQVILDKIIPQLEEEKGAGKDE